MATSDPAGASATSPISAERTGQAVVVRPNVKMMDDSALKTLTRLVDETAGPGSGIERVVIDLSRVTILPSLALGLLVGISNTCKERRQALRLAGVQPRIRDVFAITRLDRVFQFADSVEAAIAG
jgi:anti-sigma B factor antagonist